MDSRADDRAPRIDPASRHDRKLIDATFRAIAKWRPACEWGAVFVQPNCAVRIGRLGDVSDRAPADQRTADGRRRESTVPPHTARSAPTRRTDRPNQRAALHQAAQRFCRTLRVLSYCSKTQYMANAHGQLPSAENALTARAGPRYEPAGRWAVAPNDATKAVGGKDKKKAGLASPSQSSGAPHSGQEKGNTQGRKQ